MRSRSVGEHGAWAGVILTWNRDARTPIELSRVQALQKNYELTTWKRAINPLPALSKLILEFIHRYPRYSS